MTYVRSICFMYLTSRRMWGVAAWGSGESDFFFLFADLQINFCLSYVRVMVLWEVSYDMFGMIMMMTKSLSAECGRVWQGVRLSRTLFWLQLNMYPTVMA